MKQRIVVSPDKFKGSLTGQEVARAIARGVARTAPELDVVELAIADGGEGTVDAALGAGFAEVQVTAPGPIGEPLRTSFARLGDKAVVEMAVICGLPRMARGALRPMKASSRGLGVVVGLALDAGCREIVIGIGGSASTDGGAGFLRGLGARLLDASGQDVPDGGGSLHDVMALDLSAMHPALGGATIVVASDVDNPLCGPTGAAHVYAPQKGADLEQVQMLDAALKHWADVVGDVTGSDLRSAAGAGAAGGVGLAAMAVLGAELRPGIEVMLEMIDLDSHLDGAAAVITGEGSLDSQSLSGKAPIGVARLAGRRGVPAFALAGRSLLTDEQGQASGFEAIYSLSDLEADPAVCMRDADRLVQAAAAQLAADHLV